MSWQDAFVSWFPMLLLIAVWIFFMRQLRSGSSPSNKYLADLLVEQRRHNEMLEKLLTQIDVRLRKIEEGQTSN